jgi:hypothetical protein
MTREKLIALIRALSTDLDRSYDTVRGHVRSYRGWTIEGDELITGHPSRGTPETLRSHGYLTRQPLASVCDAELAEIAWHYGLISYANLLGASCKSQSQSTVH